MPVIKCSKNGKSGWKWGSRGHCYTYSAGGSKAAHAKAVKQGQAAHAAGYGG